MQFPVRSGLGDLIVQLPAYYKPNLTLGNKQYELFNKLTPEAMKLSKQCKSLYPIHGHGGGGKPHTSPSSSSELSTLILCHYFQVSTNPSPAIGILREALKESAYALRDLNTVTEEERNQIYCDVDINSRARCNFKPIPTDEGICLAFNAEAISRNFADKEYADGFYTATNLSEASYPVINFKPGMQFNRHFRDVTKPVHKHVWSFETYLILQYSEIVPRTYP